MHVRYPAESKEIDNIVLRSFVYWRKLACSTVSLTGDRGRGDDSKQYRYYKSTYSTVQGFFFTSPLTPAENCSEPPPPAIPLNWPPRTSGSAAVLRRYIELPIQENGTAIVPTADHRGYAYLGVLTAGYKFLILFLEHPSPRG